MDRISVQILKAVIFKVFNEMFFMFPEEATDEGKPNQNWHYYKIEISSKEQNFIINFLFPYQLARDMAMNFLGENQENLNEEIIHGTLQEGVNVIAGNLLNELNLPQNLKLGIPKKGLDLPEKVLQQIISREGTLKLIIEGQLFFVNIV